MCKTDISVENGVEDALKKHANSKTHKELAAAKKMNLFNITDFFQSIPESSASLTTNASSENDTQSPSDAQSSTFTSNMLDVKTKVTRGDTKYALRFVKRH